MTHSLELKTMCEHPNNHTLKLCLKITFLRIPNLMHSEAAIFYNRPTGSTICVAIAEALSPSIVACINGVSELAPSVCTCLPWLFRSPQHIAQRKLALVCRAEIKPDSRALSGYQHKASLGQLRICILSFPAVSCFTFCGTHFLSSRHRNRELPSALISNSLLM